MGTVLLRVEQVVVRLVPTVRGLLRTRCCTLSADIVVAHMSMVVLVEPTLPKRLPSLFEQLIMHLLLTDIYF